MSSTGTRKNYIFVDFENVQPNSLNLPKATAFRVLLFVGANQGKISIDLAMAMQKLGNNAEYISISGNGKNALDFHITYYLGYFVQSDPSAFFHIISKDTGFDILIEHLKKKKIAVNRYPSIEEIPIMKQSACVTKPLCEQVDMIVEFLKKRGNAKPRKLETLSNTIDSICAKKLSKEHISEIIAQMVKANYLALDDTKIIYTLG